MASAILAAFGLGVLASPALAATTVTSFAPSSNTTAKVWYEFDVRPGGTASTVDLTGTGGDLETNQPLPVGAAKLTTDFTDAAKAEVGAADNYGSPNDTFASLSISYSYHKAANVGQNAFAAPSLKLTFWNSACPGGGDCYGALVYEPYLNGPAPTVDEWTTATIDGNTGLFWTTGMFGFPNSGGGPPLKTLAEWRTAMNADFGTSTLIVVSIGVGTFNRGQIGYFDDVVVSHSAYSESYDFEPPPPALACVGFEPPMNQAYLPPALGGGEIARKVKRNRVLPFKATLVDGDGNVVTNLATAPEIEVYRDDTPSTSVDVTDEALTNNKRTEGTTFFLAGDKWVYNLGTKDFQEVGSYHAIMVSGDPSEYIIDPTCKGLFLIENRP